MYVLQCSCSGEERRNLSECIKCFKQANGGTLFYHSEGLHADAEAEAALLISI
jgi:hypothetical protein